MSEFKGTKGEWEYFNNGTFCEIQIQKPYLRSLCAVNSNIEEHEANAKLIACAPEMLEILKLFLSEFEYDYATEYECELFFKAKQLIAKATTL